MCLRFLVFAPLLVVLSLTVNANPAAPSSADPELRRLLAEAIAASDSFNDRFDAEVWLFDMSSRLKRFVPDKEFRLNLLKNIHREATRVTLPPELVIAVIEIESSFDAFAISRSGAQGLMQVMPFWLDEIGHPDDNLVDMETNLRMGCTILKYYLDMEKNNLRGALARYNGSYGDIKHTYSNKVLNALTKRWYQK
ncbi:MAG: lytic transglycosylase domain-containing protein [Gammaproteobacteria bacterium]|nr:lytic transglycosylase domain-containing protein [Gammaproteobacteria bacterium]NNJ96132.1 lytic transglycosylase domain-containing protein [Gammaproteobacteria bacterium]